MRFAKRVENLPAYVFAGMAKRIADLRASGVEVINFGMGDPDVPTPEYLTEALCAAAAKPQNSRYPDYFGKPALRRAIADWYERRFGVHLEPDTEVLPLIGSKEGIANIALAFADPGDGVLVPDPAYPVYKYGTIMADGVPVPMPMTAENGWLPDLDSLPTSNGIKVMWLNYPNNPTGAAAPMEFFEKVVAWAHRNDVVIAHDNPYSEVAYDGYRPPSILEVPGAKDVAVEFNSLSKTFSMAGHRIGMVVGSAAVIGVLSRIKSNIDSGVYGAIQDMAITALTEDQSWIPARNEIYRSRRDKIVPALRDLGMTLEVPKASLYLWAKVPPGYDAKGFADSLLMKTGVSVTPGTSYGAQGDGYVRLSLTVPDEQIDAALVRLKKFKEQEMTTTVAAT
ncbi:MAG TPA: LL-diaminopimelate aminotransferase [Chloroflexia bacterium]|nr:LL-diaminopimelate aminotransferase [Chloroflexia bacterium]